MQICDPPGPVSLLACERAGARVDLRAWGFALQGKHPGGPGPFELPLARWRLASSSSTTVLWLHYTPYICIRHARLSRSIPILCMASLLHLHICHLHMHSHWYMSRAYLSLAYACVAIPVDQCLVDALPYPSICPTSHPVPFFCMPRVGAIFTFTCAAQSVCVCSHRSPTPYFPRVFPRSCCPEVRLLCVHLSMFTC